MVTTSTLRSVAWISGLLCLALVLLVQAPAEGATRLDERARDRLLAQVEADRALLSELRKPVPIVRREAEAYLQRLRELATAADPVRLSILIHTVIQQAPNYFNWAEREFSNPDQRVFEYYLGGARGFHDALEEFRKGVYLTVINRLAVLGDLLESLSDE